MLQVILNGLSTGATYALVAAGLVLVFGILEIPDFALGTRLMAGGFVAYFAVAEAGLNYWVAVVLAALAAAALGAVAELAVYRYLRRGSAATGFVGALALMLITITAFQIAFGTGHRRLESPFGDEVVRIGSAVIPTQRLITGLVALLLIALLFAMLRYTTTGRAMRAVVEDRTGSLLIGVSINRMALLAIVIASAIAGAGGALLGASTFVYATMGDAITINAFIVVILAGMRSPAGAVAMAFVLGLAESLGTQYLSQHLTHAYGFILLLAVLAVRPHGLFDRKVTAR